MSKLAKDVYTLVLTYDPDNVPNINVYYYLRAILMEAVRIGELEDYDFDLDLTDEECMPEEEYEDEDE